MLNSCQVYGDSKIQRNLAGKKVKKIQAQLLVQAYALWNCKFAPTLTGTRRRYAAGGGRSDGGHALNKRCVIGLNKKIQLSTHCSE
jgi:hypothetical protein